MLIHMDGFDVYRQASDLNFQYLTAGAAIGTTAGRFGQGALIISGNGDNQYIQLNFNVNYTDIWMGMAIYTYDEGSPGSVFTTIGDPGDKTTFLFQSNTGPECFITYNNYIGVWKFWVNLANNPPTQIGPIGLFQTGTQQWHWVDIHYIPSPSNGTVEIWIDDIQIMNQPGIQTTTTGAANFNGI